MENRLLPIDQQLSSIHAEVVSQNRKKLKCMAETVSFCGRQGIAFMTTEMTGSMLKMLQTKTLEAS